MVLKIEIYVHKDIVQKILDCHRNYIRIESTVKNYPYANLCFEVDRYFYSF
jgi:hypothetical protein